ncbi:diguanylate cyclase [Lysinibacillus capsici]|uniref:diguanylate cyclase n=1 Tax=Lysinibacillus capsici TaxID=2115968 RepID=UPI001C10E0A6|nr:diguanylate cyclase [Lysinibacillus capsici]MBU5254063.1 diguanylate cyclase [Lysinibacillus capsici]
METAKYHRMVYTRICENLQKWDNSDFVREDELYSFLHTLKGTAGSIGLHELTSIAREKLELLNEDSNKQWAKSEWKKYLAPFIESVHFYQENNSMAQHIEHPTTIIKNPAKQDFILIIDDDVVFISYLKNVLEKKGYSVIAAHNGKRGLALIYELQPSIVFLDIMLPDSNGFSILDNIKKTKKELMFVTLISSNDSKENRVRTLEMGAMDFMAKPIDEELLVAYVSNRLAYKRELEQAIVIDELTQIYNRKFMESQMKLFIKHHQQNKEHFSIAMIDLDYFKKVNDTYGHLVGDEVLKGFASLVKELKGAEEIACRFGGEEFVILMPRTTKKEAFIFIEKLRTSMEKKIFTANGTSFHVTFSSGIAEATSTNLHPKKMLEEADQALYTAKQLGRNQTIIFDNIAAVEKRKVKIKIVVIDDVYIIRDLITNHFKHLEEKEDYMIETLAFPDGISFLEANWYDPECKYIILLDWILPKMDGIEVLSKIREQHASSNVIVSMLTSRVGEEYVMKAFINGADDYIVKPFNVAEVSERIIRLIHQMFL